MKNQKILIILGPRIIEIHLRKLEIFTFLPRRAFLFCLVTQSRDGNRTEKSGKNGILLPKLVIFCLDNLPKVSKALEKV